MTQPDMPTTALCIFCQIVAGATDGHAVYTSPRVWGLASIAPIRPGHLLVIPTRHVETYYDLEEPDYTELMRVVRRLAAVVQEVYRPVRVGLVAAGWDVPHAHLHIIPMHDYHDITSKPMLDQQVSRASPEDLADTVRRVMAHLTAP
jgi:histidine triad (HIT) family protein